MAWTVFESETPDDGVVNQFLQSVQNYQTPVNESVEAVIEQPLESGGGAATSKPQRMRLNTKLRSAT